MGQPERGDAQGHLCLQKNVWAMRQGPLYHARVDELTRPQGVYPDPIAPIH